MIFRWRNIWNYDIIDVNFVSCISCLGNLAPNATHVLSNVGTSQLFEPSCKSSLTPLFEPIPNTYNALTNNIVINKLNHKVEALNIGLSDKEGFLHFTNNLDTMNHAVLKCNKINESTINIPVDTLDNILSSREMPNLIKLDVEGFEFNVIAGGHKSFQNDTLNCVIIELNGNGERYGHKDIEIHNLLTGYGFKPYTYNPFDREILVINFDDRDNDIIYIKNFELAKSRVESAQAFDVLNYKI